MDVRELSLSEQYLSHFEADGIRQLYPPQAASVEAGILEDANILVSIPTASGKTFVSILGLLSSDGPGLYICPFRALAREKYTRFSELPNTDVALSIGATTVDERLGDPETADLIVATSEKVDAAIRTGAAWIRELQTIVVDEIHLIGSEDRGPTLEMAVAMLSRQLPDAQFIGLSATISNPNEIADWLNATPVVSTWRPIELRRGICDGKTIQFESGSTQTISTSEQQGPLDSKNAEMCRSATAAVLVNGAINNGGQALIFVRSRSRAESLAKWLSTQQITDTSSSALATELKQTGDTGIGTRLSEAVSGGIGFHHAGLPTEQRQLLESAFRSRKLDCICATPTLAAGVNLPARRVIIADLKRYTGANLEWLPTFEVHQMMGRSGRPGMDPYGEAILFSPDPSAEQVKKRYFDSELDSITSHLATPEALKTHVLALIATGDATSQDTLQSVFAQTFFAAQSGSEALMSQLPSVLNKLQEMEMINNPSDTNMQYVATEVGEIAAKQYLSPQTAADIISDLKDMKELASTHLVTFFELISTTAEMPNVYLSDQDRAEILRFARKYRDVIITDEQAVPSFETWLADLRITQILLDWSSGKDKTELEAAYHVSPGDLERIFETTVWLLRATNQLAMTINDDYPTLTKTVERVVNQYNDPVPGLFEN